MRRLALVSAATAAVLVTGTAAAVAVSAQLLNEAIWESVKGAHSVMPPPQHHVIAPSATADSG